MKTIRYILGCLVMVGLLSACEDYLDPKETSPYGDEFAYTLPNAVEGFLTNAYAAIPGQIDNYGGDFLDAATGDAVTNQYGGSIYALGAGKMSSTSNPIGIWDAAYSAFQWINLFQEKSADTATVKWWISNSEYDSLERSRLMGESYFLRAYWGVELLRVYGGATDAGEVLGYPIVTEFAKEDEVDAYSTMPRNTYEECVLQILEDCDSAISLLPMSYSGDDVIVGKSHIGRATQAAAYVLKSRVAIFSASPAFNLTNDISKWERAAVFSQEAIDMVGLSYRALTYTDLVSPSLSATPADYLFRRYHNNRSLESRNLPPAFWGAGRTNPSQNLVDAFPMSNGYPITDPLSGYDPQNPYTDRDPRLRSVVLFNGEAVETGGRPLEVADTIAQYIAYDIDTTEIDDGMGNITLQIDTVADTWVYRKGLDSQRADYRATRTGYYLRKWISNKANMLSNVNQQLNAEHMYPYIRGVEAFYNLAEASLEATGSPTSLVDGCSLSAYDIISDVRRKAMFLYAGDSYLDAQTSQEQMRTMIQNERRIEFAFENHRYFDLRRWMLPLSETVRGMSVTQDEEGVYTYVGTDPNDEASHILVESRNFDADRYYYQPLPYDELAKNPNLVNNAGW